MEKKWFYIGTIVFDAGDHYWKTEVVFATDKEVCDKINKKDFIHCRFKGNLFIHELRESGFAIDRREDLIEEHFIEDFMPAG